MQGKQDVVVRPVHLEQPNLHKLAEAVIRLLLEDVGEARVVRRSNEPPATLRHPRSGGDADSSLDAAS